MKVNDKMKKILSIALTLCMVLSYTPSTAFAVGTDNLCDHHAEHTADCGYVQAVAGADCTHEHSKDCYKIVACKHIHGDECADTCTHECTVENGCITMEQSCQHSHGDCGYSEGTAEVPCGHVHGEDCGYVAASQGTACAHSCEGLCTLNEDGTYTCLHAEHDDACGYTAPVEGTACGHTEHTDCGYAPATEGTPCTHVCEVKVNSPASCYKLLCSHSDGGHDDACGYAPAIEGHECHFECNECAAALTSEEEPELPTRVTAENYASLGLTADYVDYYAISNAGQLFWFAEYVNSGNNTIDAVLVEDIDLENRLWTPIGVHYDSDSSKNVHFKGTFDGNKHIIKNLFVTVEDDAEAGFFGCAESATIKNFGIVNASVENKSGIRVGVIAGELHKCTIQDVFSTGTITLTTTHQQKGGIAGECANSTLKNCYTTYGCLTDSTETLPTTLENCYYMANSGNAGSCGTAMSEAQFASGEVAYLLGEPFGQTIGTHDYPILSGEPVLTDGSSYYNDVVEVTITWTALEFTYAAENTWNPETLKYEAAGGGWVPVADGGKVTVENNSSPNHTFTVTPEFQSDMTYLSGSFDQSSATLHGGKKITFTLTLTGKPEGETFTDKLLGNVTIKIEETQTA